MSRREMMCSDLTFLHRAVFRIGMASGGIVAILVGMLVPIFLIPGNGNPGHICVIIVCGFCGLLLWLRRGTSVLTNGLICVFVLLAAWPLSIALRDATAVVMPDLIVGYFVFERLRWFLPLMLFVFGAARWLHTHSWMALIIAVAPLSIQIGYVVLRSPLSAQIARIQWYGITVSGTAKDGFDIGILKDQPDDLLRVAFQDLQRLPALHSAIVRSRRVTDEGLCLLSRLQELESLELDSVPVSHKGWACVSEMRRLHRLSLSHMPCRANLGALSGSRSLRMLQIGDCAVCDDAVRNIATIRSLTAVWFTNTDVSSHAIRDLKASRPDLLVDCCGDRMNK